MNLLAIETALFQCSIALLHSGVVSSLEADQPSQQSTQLFPLMNKLLEQNSLRLVDIDAIACTIGPGSFTGVRIGIAAVRAISKIIPHIKPLGISTLELVAYGAISRTHCHPRESGDPDFCVPTKKQKLDSRFRGNDKTVVMALIEAGRGEFYMQKFNRAMKPLTEALILTEEQLQQQLQPNEIVVSNKDTPITASLLLERAFMLLEAGVIHDAIHPLYVKAPSITKQKL